MKKQLRFYRLLKGLEILANYAPERTELNPIPSSFPNGAPDHSSSAYLSICVTKYLSNDHEERMKELGWKEEQEGIWWVFQ